jgi:phage-related protein
MWYLDFWKPSHSEKSPVEKSIRKIKDKVRLQQLRKLVRLVETFGPSLPMPNNKNLRGGLFELRDTATRTRYYYCETVYLCEISKNTRKVILLLLEAGLNKNAQQDDIELARDRMEELAESNILNSEGFKIICENEED